MTKKDDLYVDTSPDKPEKAHSILINFVLDKSGSMSSIRDATISGFNEFKNDQAREDGEAYFTLTLFDTTFYTPITGVPLNRVRDLSYESYAPGGMTALYDAIGRTMKLTDGWVAKHKPDQVLFVIMTDGHENSSREYTQRQIFDLIADRQANADYEFVFLGANQDSYAIGRDIGIRGGRTFDYDAEAASTRATMDRISLNVKAYRRHGERQVAEWFAPEFESLGVDDGVPLSEKKANYLAEQGRKGLDAKQGTRGRSDYGGQNDADKNPDKHH